MTTQSVVVRVAEPAGGYQGRCRRQQRARWAMSLVDVHRLSGSGGAICAGSTIPTGPTHARSISSGLPGLRRRSGDPPPMTFRRTAHLPQKIVDTGARIIYRLGVSIEHTDGRSTTPIPHRTSPSGQGSAADRQALQTTAGRTGIRIAWRTGRSGMRPILAIIIVVRHFRQYFELYQGPPSCSRRTIRASRWVVPRRRDTSRRTPAAAFLERFLAHCRRTTAAGLRLWHKYTDPTTGH